MGTPHGIGEGCGGVPEIGHNDSGKLMSRIPAAHIHLRTAVLYTRLMEKLRGMFRS